MKGGRIIALGQEAYWLQKIKEAASEINIADDVRCFNNVEVYLNSVDEVDPDALVLVDAFEIPAVGNIVRRLRESGWRYVVVVAADPSVKEVRTVLHDAGGYDYWKKTFNILEICAQIEECLGEMKMT